MWTQQLVEALAESKRQQLPFNTAWVSAIHDHPPRLIELGVMRAHEDSLLDQSAAGALEWYRAVCQNAYEDRQAPDGSPSRLRGLHSALENGFSEVEPARSGRVLPKAAAA